MARRKAHRPDGRCYRPRPASRPRLVPVEATSTSAGVAHAQLTQRYAVSRPTSRTGLLCRAASRPVADAGRLDDRPLEVEVMWLVWRENQNHLRTVAEVSERVNLDRPPSQPTGAEACDKEGSRARRVAGCRASLVSAGGNSSWPGGGLALEARGADAVPSWTGSAGPCSAPRSRPGPGAGTARGGARSAGRRLRPVCPATPAGSQLRALLRGGLGHAADRLGPRRLG